MTFTPSQRRLMVSEAWQRSNPETVRAARLLLMGQWLTQAGIPPGSEVIVHNTHPGRLTIVVNEPVLYPYHEEQEGEN